MIILPPPKSLRLQDNLHVDLTIGVYVKMYSKLSILILSFVLLSCADHYQAEEFDLVKLKEDSAILFQANSVNGKISAQWWTPDIVKLRPIEIRSEKEGVYIKLDSFFAEESGLFIPVTNAEVKHSVKGKTSYVLLGHNVYSYYIKG